MILLLSLRINNFLLMNITADTFLALCTGAKPERLVDALRRIVVKIYDYSRLICDLANLPTYGKISNFASGKIFIKYTSHGKGITLGKEYKKI